MKASKPFLLFIIILLFASCIKEKKITAYSETQPSQRQVLASTLNISLMDYDSLLISNAPNSTLDEQSVDSILVGERITGEFVIRARTKPSYVNSENRLSIRYSLPLKIYEEFLRAYYFTVRFLLKDSSYVDVDTLALMYKYPYSSVEIFLKTLEETGKELKDFNLVGNELYFISTDGQLCKINLITKKVEHLLYSVGDFYLAGNSQYQFVVNRGYQVYRYNVQTDTVDSMWNMQPEHKPFIKGIEVFQNKIYLLVLNPARQGNNDSLFVYSLNGQLLQSIPLGNIAETISHCMVVEPYLYCNNYSENKLIRLNLNTYEITAGSLLPSLNSTGMDCQDGKFYFLDNVRHMIGNMPFSQIE